MLDEQIRQLERDFISNPDSGPRLLRAYQRSDPAKYLDFRAQLGYVAEVSVLPFPTDEQTKNFVSYVAKAHSWYKHLDPETPELFHFFLDPHAMMVRNLEPAKTQEEEFTEVGRKVLGFRNHREEDCFHYSERATDEYRKQFGYWTYCSNDIETYACIHSETLVKLPIPKHLLQIGQAGLTAYVYGDPNRDILDNAPPNVPDPNRQEYLMFNYQKEKKCEELHQLMFRAMKNFLRQLELEVASYR